MRITCAWCQRELGEKPPYEDKRTTHGICDDCLLHYFPHHSDKIKGILEVGKIEDIYKKRRFIMKLAELTPEQVEKYIGKVLTAKQLKSLFGYSQNTYINDTVLYQRKWLKVNYRQPSLSGPYLYEVVKGQDF